MKIKESAKRVINNANELKGDTEMKVKNAMNRVKNAIPKRNKKTDEATANVGFVEIPWFLGYEVAPERPMKSEGWDEHYTSWETM